MATKGEESAEAEQEASPGQELGDEDPEVLANGADAEATADTQADSPEVAQEEPSSAPQEAAAPEGDSTGSDPATSNMEAAVALKAAGNDALKAADLPTAILRYEEAIEKVDRAIGFSSQTKVLKQNALVRYDENRFATVDVSDQIFGDYILKDLGTKHTVTERLGYQDVDIRFKRKEIKSVPQEMFDLRLACLQNICLVSMKLARASQRQSDFQDVVVKANAALCMDGFNIKALIRKGAALLEMKELMKAFNVLKLAYDKTFGKDVEVLQLLQICLAAKGKGKGKGKNGKLDPFAEEGEQPAGPTYGPPIASDSE
mmetsp:Transcript_20130/g.46295  ORF Transcript_20130/g.46295 Transcript_20130/m.46295 type:complete len:316 (+) Transcript_20130:90-1037(+)